MKSYRLVEAGVVGADDTPAFKFEVELHDGRDIDGEFHIQFAAAERDGECRFVVNSPRGPLAIFDQEASIEFATRLADTGEYIILADYENRAWDDRHAGTITMPIMGRDLGGAVDFRERYDLPPEEHNAVKQIRDVLTDTASP